MCVCLYLIIYIIFNNYIKYNLGLWYEQARDNETPFQKGDCATAVYSEEENKYYVLNSEDRNGVRTKVKGTLQWPNPPKGSLLVNFGPKILRYFNFLQGTYDILATDYISYTIVHSCNRFFFIYYIEYVWILTREKTPSVEFVKSKIDYIVSLGYSRGSIRVSKQGGDCVY